MTDPIVATRLHASIVIIIKTGHARVRAVTKQDRFVPSQPS